MKKRLMLTSILLMTGSSFLFASSDCGATKLSSYMKDIGGDMRVLSADIKSGDNAAAANKVTDLISHFEKSRNETPYKFKADSLQGDQLAEQKANFVKVIDDTVLALKNLEVALQSDNASDVRKWLGEISAQRNIGHGAFRLNC
ncbi:MAG: cytochrome b562 [Marinomonas hwangdonensis]|nr:cytochrome b562 [Marinomonas hwangdonensis]